LLVRNLVGFLTRSGFLLFLHLLVEHLGDNSLDSLAQTFSLLFLRPRQPASDGSDVGTLQHIFSLVRELIDKPKLLLSSQPFQLLSTQDFVAQHLDELNLKVGDIITVFVEDEWGWWKGSTIGGTVGLFPVRCCDYFSRSRDPEIVEQAMDEMFATSPLPSTEPKFLKPLSVRTPSSIILQSACRELQELKILISSLTVGEQQKWLSIISIVQKKVEQGVETLHKQEEVIQALKEKVGNGTSDSLEN